MRCAKRAVFLTQAIGGPFLDVGGLAGDEKDDVVQPAEVVGNDIFGGIANELDLHLIGDVIVQQLPNARSPAIDERIARADSKRHRWAVPRGRGHLRQLLDLRDRATLVRLGCRKPIDTSFAPREVVQILRSRKASA